LSQRPIGDRTARKLETDELYVSTANDAIEEAEDL
jgi:hypothetical protein